jgi:hypothetical protein
MKTVIFNKQRNQLLFLILSIGLLASLKASGQIVLLDERIPLKPTGFYIAGVIDERTNRDPVAELVTKDPSSKVTVKGEDLQGGVAPAINRFLGRNLAKDPSVRPVIISIKELKLTEKPSTGSSIEGQAKLYVSFGLQKDYGVDNLLTCRFGLNYKRPALDNNQAERHLRGILKSSLVYFDDWMKANINSNYKLATSVKISFTDYREEVEGDTIYYSSNRPLTWNDFKSRNTHFGSKYLAVIMPSIGYNQEAKIVNGTIYVNIAMKAYVPKSACWAAYNGRDSYALNHEQRHFDITKIIAEQFKQKVLAENLTPDTYEAFINMQYLDSFRDMDKMQRAYDKETGHGINRIAQASWDARIDKVLKVMLAVVN